MTESGTPPPSGDHTPIIPAAGRPASAGEIPRERFGFMRDTSGELIQFESVGEGRGLGPTYARDRDGWARPSLHPLGIVCAETHTSGLPKALAQAQAAGLPNVVVRDDGADEDATLTDTLTLTVPVGDELFVGGPEPADWVRLPDPRTAPTEPSLRRRVQTELRISSERPTPIEPNLDRRRERLRNVVALSIGAFVAVIGLSSLVVTSLVSNESSPLPERQVPVRAIEAARTATLPDDIPPPPGPTAEADEAAVVSVPGSQPVDVALDERARAAAVQPGRVESAASGFVKPMAPASVPGAPKPSRIVRVQSGLARSSAAPSSASLPRASSALSTQPKKRLWFPPE